MTTSEQRTLRQLRPAILCCVDGSPASWRALDYACAASKATRRRLVVLCIAPPGPFSEEMQEYARMEHFGDDADPLLFDMVVGGILDLARARAAGNGCKSVEFVGKRGDAASAILAAARDLNVVEIVLGRRKRPELVAAVLGSVSRQVVKGASCPCTLVTDSGS
jgi:nucleotide-binding universal stress UspA family protein